MVIAGKILDFSDAAGMGLILETQSPFTVFSLGCIFLSDYVPSFATKVVENQSQC